MALTFEGRKQNYPLYDHLPMNVKSQMKVHNSGAAYVFSRSSTAHFADVLSFIEVEMRDVISNVGKNFANINPHSDKLEEDIQNGTVIPYCYESYLTNAKDDAEKKERTLFITKYNVRVLVDGINPETERNTYLEKLYEIFKHVKKHFGLEVFKGTLSSETKNLSNWNEKIYTNLCMNVRKAKLKEEISIDVIDNLETEIMEAHYAYHDFTYNYSKDNLLWKKCTYVEVAVENFRLCNLGKDNMKKLVRNIMLFPFTY